MILATEHAGIASDAVAKCVCAEFAKHLDGAIDKQNCLLTTSTYRGHPYAKLYLRAVRRSYSEKAFY